MLFIGALVGAPLVLAVYLSLTDATAGSLDRRVGGARQLPDQLDDPIFVDAIWHTFLFTVISQAIVVLCAGLIAHALVHTFRGRWFLRFLILLPWAAPIALTAIGFVWLFDTQASIFTWFLVQLHSSTSRPPGVARHAELGDVLDHLRAGVADDPVRDRHLHRRHRLDPAGGRRRRGDRRERPA